MRPKRLLPSPEKSNGRAAAARQQFRCLHHPSQPHWHLHPATVSLHSPPFLSLASSAHTPLRGAAPPFPLATQPRAPPHPSLLNPVHLCHHSAAAPPTTPPCLPIQAMPATLSHPNLPSHPTAPHWHPPQSHSSTPAAAARAAHGPTHQLPPLFFPPLALSNRRRSVIHSIRAIILTGKKRLGQLVALLKGG